MFLEGYILLPELFSFCSRDFYFNFFSRYCDQVEDWTTATYRPMNLTLTESKNFSLLPNLTGSRNHPVTNPKLTVDCFLDVQLQGP